MRLRWSQRLVLAAVAAAVCLVPIVGSLAHSHAHHEAQEEHTHGADVARAPGGPSVAATHDAGDHQHLPNTDATLSRIGFDWVAAPAITVALVTPVAHGASTPAPAPDDPRPQRTHDPPAAPRAPPLA
jgi:hypothetical protein